MITIILAILLFTLMGYALYKLMVKKVQPFPAAWRGLLEQNVGFYQNLDVEEKKRFEQRMMQFLSEVYIDSVDVEVEDLDKVLLAASAVIPVFGFKEWHYSSLSGILVYPDNFNEEYEFDGHEKGKIIAGVVGTGRLEKKMIISKKALRAGFKNPSDKRNTAIHEFVHLIDKMDERTDGIPEVLMTHSYSIPWLKLIHDEMEKIHRNKSDIRDYGGTNQAEFFAVASEYFFERPELMKRKHPKLYAMLKESFGLKG